METPHRTPKDIGMDKNRGSGYPLEKSRMSIRNLNNALEESGRRVRDVLVVVLSSSSLLSILRTKKLTNRLPSRPHSRSAKKTAVQSESRTRSAFLPKQYWDKRSLSAFE
mmetsp:Transcript_24098/g.51092  ORF Transcript_24098/g.51092 Transcript_24098/m.51092 type:complete len:110 (+) Transcript_24098:491-820(+)